MDGELKRLLRDLQGKPYSRAQRRAIAGLVCLGDQAIEPVAALFFESCKSVDLFTRDAAFRVLEQIGAPQVVPHLLRAVTETGCDHYAAARFLARRRDPALLAALLEVARSGGRHAAGAALTSLGECQERRLLPDLLQIAMTRRDEAREDAIEAAGRLGGHDAFDALAPLLQGPEPRTRQATAKVLTEMKHPEAARHIAQALKAETDEASIELLASFLMKLNAAECLPTLLDALKRLPDTSGLREPFSVLRGPLTRLRGVNPAAVAPYLVDADANIRIAAAIALGNSENLEAVAPLLAARTDADYGVRMQVREAFRRLRQDGVPVAMPSPRLRDRAAVLLEGLAAYFQIPSSKGFSAYRTGWFTHVAFSAVVAAIVFTLALRRLEPLPTGALALLGVVLLWGVGARVGVLSHYNPLLMIAAVVVLVGGIVYWPFLIVGLVIAVAGHALMIPVVFILRRLRDVLT